MSKRMLIDASHPEETRVVVIDGNRVEEFDFESAAKRPLKGNIYLAKVTRVEPSLQAAFVEYGGNRQGFLAFSEIHPDYYQIPVADRLAILQAQTERLMAEDDVESFDTHRTEHDVAAGDHDAAPGEHDAPHGEREAAGEHYEDSESRSTEAEAHEAENFVAQETADNLPPDPAERDAAADAEPDEVEQPAETVVELQAAEFGMPGELSAIEEPAPEAIEIFEHHGSAEESHEPEMAQPEPQDDDVAASSQVQAEATGVPSAYQRRENRPFDRPRPRRRQYKIQEVIKRRQVMLVQVVKEERGNKGASLTTFLSLAGRYCVLMPNTPRGGGISRKITNAADRKRLKSAAQSLELPEGMGLIIRTAGANRTKVEIRRDYEYLLRLWDTVRELTLKSNAPSLVYEEGSLIKRAIRDLYGKDITEVLVDGENGYRDAKEFMRMLMPSHAKNVKPYKEPLPLFQKLQVESQLDAMFSPIVTLKSGGYIVINQTEALVSIDVNSGRATREHSIEDTAYKTNLEAADEIARQLRLRDLAGLIVIDFIDMEDSKNDRNVEKRLHNAVRNDRARIQIGRISQFGLLELSRQRLRAGVVAGSTITCPHCNGQGIIRSTESAALRLLRALDEEGQRQPSVNLSVRTPLEVAIYTLNQKRRELARIEEAYDVSILFEPQANMVSGSFDLQRTGVRIPAARPKLVAVSVEGGFQESPPAEAESDAAIAEAPEAPPAEAPVQAQASDGEPGRRRRRRRRGGRGRDQRFGQTAGEQDLPQQDQLAQATEFGTVEVAEMDGEEATEDFEAGDAEHEAESATETAPQGAGGDRPEHRRRRRRRGRRGRRFESHLPTGSEGHGAADAAHLEAGVAAQLETPIASPDSNRSPDETPSQEPDLVTEPNTPSSPVWSLVDHAEEPLFPPPPAMAAKPVTPLPSAEAEPVAQGTAPQPIAETAEAVPDEGDVAETEPREARRGWWQRRFKA
ncbi:MAG TPA: Rne/Rng family ribonuclease [Micropepsaceae bacterium]|nr:Rne/Rng family ribonuclease [Micropepsaceae bacterium]